MSLLGQNQKSLSEHMFSASLPKADIAPRGRHVRFVPEADIDRSHRHAASVSGSITSCPLLKWKSHYGVFKSVGGPDRPASLSRRTHHLICCYRRPTLHHG